MTTDVASNHMQNIGYLTQTKIPHALLLLFSSLGRANVCSALFTREQTLALTPSHRQSHQSQPPALSTRPGLSYKGNAHKGRVSHKSKGRKVFEKDLAFSTGWSAQEWNTQTKNYSILFTKNQSPHSRLRTQFNGPPKPKPPVPCTSPPQPPPPPAYLPRPRGPRPPGGPGGDQSRLSRGGPLGRFISGGPSSLNGGIGPRRPGGPSIGPRGPGGPSIGPRGPWKLLLFFTAGFSTARTGRVSDVDSRKSQLALHYTIHSQKYKSILWVQR